MDNRALIERVYRDYGPALYRFCLLQMKNPADAEDVLQEVFCKYPTRAPGFASPEQERAWLFRVAVNRCRDEFRKSRRDIPLELAPEIAMPAEQRELLEEVAALLTVSVGAAAVIAL